jgi:hypothetical protein
MAITYAEFGVSKPWFCAGAGDELILKVPAGESRRGIQVGIADLDLETVDVEVTVPPGIVLDADIETGAGRSALVGKDWEMTQIRITGAAADTYTYYFAYP